MPPRALNAIKSVLSRRSGFVYLIESNNLYKIGRCLKMDQRLFQYTTENPFGATLLAHKNFSDYKQAERDLLNRYKQYKFRGEWHQLPQDKINEIIKFLTPS